MTNYNDFPYYNTKYKKIIFGEPESGMQIKALSEMLGHSSVKITMDRYVHLSMSFKQSQITILRFPDSEIINRQETSQNYPKRQENMVETGVTSWIERI